LSNLDARTILVNGTVIDKQRLISPYAFELLMRLTFPASSERVKVSTSVRLYDAFVNSDHKHGLYTHTGYREVWGNLSLVEGSGSCLWTRKRVNETSHSTNIPLFFDNSWKK